ncbi:MAG: MaoC family dehydratase N-terminal domain-containing protein [Hyphomonadaceae bacterium]|nr:MaoC family dehydratase N-terminal domain-containing protein [Hyphomonadaceae bacterium]
MAETPREDATPKDHSQKEHPWGDWIGRTETAHDRIGETPARALAATLNRPADFPARPGDALPPLWSWLYFLPLAPLAEVGPDGHPRRGGFLPPVDLPRRMWAGSRCTFHGPLRVGADAVRTSTITRIAQKSGGAGTMVFVTVAHAVHCDGALVMAEEQDIVYLPMPERFSPPAPTPAPACAWREAAPVDPVLLFRFSALTFNGHRIHYDRAYAMDVEKYPGLVVHGPLQAVLLFDAATRHTPHAAPARFDFRGLRPLFDFDQVSLAGRAREDGGLDLFTVNGDGAVGMQAAMHWRPR